MRPGWGEGDAGGCHVFPVPVAISRTLCGAECGDALQAKMTVTLDATRLLVHEVCPLWHARFQAPLPSRSPTLQALP